MATLDRQALEDTLGWLAAGSWSRDIKDAALESGLMTAAGGAAALAAAYGVFRLSKDGRASWCSAAVLLAVLWMCMLLSSHGVVKRLSAPSISVLAVVGVGALFTFMCVAANKKTHGMCRLGLLMMACGALAHGVMLAVGVARARDSEIVVDAAVMFGSVDFTILLFAGYALRACS